MTGVPPPTLVTRKTCPIKVELTVTPYIEIVLTLGPSLLGVTFDIVSMTTKVEFPTTTKLNMADTSSCEVEFDVDVGAGLTSIEALKGTITLVGTDGICGDAPDDAYVPDLSSL